ncbi:MAG TPA: DUF3180 domain-containing protein [Mycobacteriales bacterium]|nr:DUF3180 domain-containing protein [Mycobacteriales bacterium]
MRPTRLSALVVAAVAAGVPAYALLRLRYEDLPAFPRLAPAALLLLGLAEGYQATSVRARLRGKGRPIPPLIVARLAALAKASSLTGALFVGVYAALLGLTVPDLDKPAFRGDAVTGALGVVAAVVLVVLALALERACRVPRPPDKPDARLPSRP